MKNKKVKFKQFLAGRRLKIIPVILSVICLTVGLTAAPFAGAESLQDQINSLNAQNSKVQSTVSTLSVKADNYKAAIQQLQSQIASIQTAIDSNQAEQTKLNAEIQVYQAKLNQQKAILGSDIESMYVNGQMSTIEELASSKNLSSFVNAQTYRNAVQNEVQNTMKEISTLQNKLDNQQAQVTQLLTTQKLQQQQKVADQQQQTQLLSLNQQQQASYTKKLQANDAKLNQLQKEEEKANESGVQDTLASGAACGGSATYDGVNYTDTYPANYCEAGQDTITDQWGLLNRECTSYAAWMEASTGHSVPYGLGNATDWPSNVPSSWVSSTPQAGDIAIRPAVPGLTVDGESDVGHAMYVEKVINSDTILVSEYNEDFNGDWSIQVRSTNAPYNGYTDNLVFIHFPAS